MSKNEEIVTILMADDDEQDCILAQKALKQCHLVNDLHFVRDGVELMDYLNRRGPYAERGKAPRPGLILLDLNMPRKDGRAALEEIKNDSNLQRIPVVVLTTSEAEEDILRTYDLGASSYITKPVTFQGLVDIMENLKDYWFKIVRLP